MQANSENISGNQNAFSRVSNKCLPGLRLGLILSLVIYLAMLIVGILGKNDCPVNKYIPLFLIITGIVGLISKLTTVVRDKLENYFPVKYLESALYIVELVIFSLGCYWVLKEFQPNYNPGGSHYCKKSVYLLSFIYIAVALAIMLATLAGFLCFLLSAKFLSSRPEEDPEAQRHMNNTH
ncbi:unnamed protein product [Brassicogethes aeneus]|uniref:Uncharacterized protein n=1 Tax=Brassicogethes aeneus TaxID=1431903 RepID=A0A9P0B7L1_BRAAE|nr:unnamed protein product [Brassicogethes aeneus]